MEPKSLTEKPLASPAASEKPAVAPPARVHKFVKTLHPASPVYVGGQRITFTLTKSRTGGFNSASFYETTDPSLAAQLKKDGPKYHVHPNN